MVNMAVILEPGQISDSMASSLSFKSCKDHIINVYLKAIMEVYRITFTCLCPKEEYSAILAAIFVTCYYVVDTLF